MQTFAPLGIFSVLCISFVTVSHIEGPHESVGRGTAVFVAVGGFVIVGLGVGFFVGVFVGFFVGFFVGVKVNVLVGVEVAV